MTPSAKLGFHLQPLVEELGQDELSKFKSLLRDHSLKEELQHLLQTKVEEASRKQPADLLTACCPSLWVEMVITAPR
ncbi:pyrin domain-containing protein 2 [Oryx dammah]|uniref:pyrin domain-containing protein 2 n=1 Tax=Oryx dammah TaxID=59534 RepID=UPI001A9ABAD2|nr:pyrin domain-containing protein 2 [Oryx dammah]